MSPCLSSLFLQQGPIDLFLKVTRRIVASPCPYKVRLLITSVLIIGLYHTSSMVIKGMGWKCSPLPILSIIACIQNLSREKCNFFNFFLFCGKGGRNVFVYTGASPILWDMLFKVHYTVYHALEVILLVILGSTISCKYLFTLIFLFFWRVGIQSYSQGDWPLPGL